MNKLGKGFNRVFSLVLIMALLVSSLPVAWGVGSVWNGKVATGFAGGTGTEDDPYLIQTAEELAYLAASVNGGNTYKGKYIQLEDDIVLNDTTDWESWDRTAPANEWTPIGNSDYSFSGVFDGGGHAVAGVYINTVHRYVGLFGHISDGMVINLGVIDSYIHSTENAVGGVCGTNNGTLIWCDNAGTVTGNSEPVGGVCGNNNGTLIWCDNAGTVTGSWANVGGVCGLNKGTVTVCYNTGAITSDRQVGGVCGNNYGGTITECYNTGSVTAPFWVGGVCGSNWSDSAIAGCYNTGTVTGEHYVGGVCAENEYLVVACYNMGTLTGDRFVGGVCGANMTDAAIANCYNAGAMKGNEEYIGGVCGKNFGIITTCYNTGAVKSKSAVDGVCGYEANGSITDCYYLDTSCTNKSASGTALTKAQMRVASNFEGFDFESVWFLDPAFATHPYPILREMPFNPMLGFADVSTGRYYYDAVMWAAKNGITTGVDETHFAPNADCTRAQAVMFLWNAAGCPVVSKNVKNPFSDVKKGRYYYDAVLWAVSVGITDGTDATHFSPNEKLNRATFVTFLWRAVGKPEVPVTDTFTDVQSDKFYATAVAWAVANGITDGITATTFAPNQLCSRAQVVTFLHRALT